MSSKDISDEIKHLAYTFIKVSYERTGGELKKPLGFLDIYYDACTKIDGSNNKYETNLEIRQHVRDYLLKSGLIVVDPKEVDSIYLSQKAINEYADH